MQLEETAKSLININNVQVVELEDYGARHGSSCIEGKSSILQ